jgi:predicted HAD superfamily hydrolase
VKSRLIKAIDRCEILSLDVFDTAILRRVEQPTDVFELVAGQYRHLHSPQVGWNFARARVDAERLARQRSGAQRPDADITLDDIYACLEPPDGWSKPTLHGLEIDLERLVCTRNEAVHAIYHRALELGKTVVFASDMYLPKEIVEEVLHTQGYTKYARLFLSSALGGATKSSGQLYQRMLDELGVPAARILHVGNDFSADVQQARSVGLGAFHYQHATPPAPDRSVASGAAAAIHRGLVSNRRRTAGREEFFVGLGYACAGILYLGFQRWIKAELARADVERVFFISRDGWIMKQVYSRLGGGPPSSYLYGSRRAFTVPAITELDELTLRFLCSGRPLKVGQYLERIGLDPADFGDAIRRAGLVGPMHRVDVLEDAERLRSLFRLVEPEIRVVAERERTVTLEYLRQSGFSTAKRVALVDLGWWGTQQRALVKLLKLAGAEVDVQGYYLGTLQQTQFREAEDVKLRGWLFEDGLPAEYCDLIQTCCEIFEFIHGAPHGLVLGFERTGGAIAPIFAASEVMPSQAAAAERLRTAALAYIEDFLALAERLPWLGIERELAIAPLVRVLTRPTLEEARCLGDLTHTDGFGAQTGTPIARPPGRWESLCHPMRVVVELDRTYWREGYIRQLVGSNRAVWRAAELGYRAMAALRGLL